MPRGKNRLWSSYRGATKHVRELEAQLNEKQRRRPRTRGKKAAKTRAINKLKRQVAAAKGQLTKARNAIAKAARGKKSSVGIAKRKRSEAAKRGWATRRARKATQVTETPSRGLAIPFLTVAQGVIGVWPPSKDDRSKVGKYWSTVDRLLSNQPASFDRFMGDSIYDEIGGKRLPFVTDLNTIVAHSDEYLFGLTFYRNRHEFERFA